MHGGKDERSTSTGRIQQRLLATHQSRGTHTYLGSARNAYFTKGDTRGQVYVGVNSENLMRHLRRVIRVNGKQVGSTWRCALIARAIRPASGARTAQRSTSAASRLALFVANIEEFYKPV